MIHRSERGCLCTILVKHSLCTILNAKEASMNVCNLIKIYWVHGFQIFIAYLSDLDLAPYTFVISIVDAVEHGLSYKAITRVFCFSFEYKPMF